MVNYRYEIDDSSNYEIRVWDLDNVNELNAPFLLQPTWPCGTSWANREEAELWVQRFTANHEDVTNGAPGLCQEIPFIPYVPPNE